MIKMSTIQELDRKICQEMNVSHDDYLNMTISEQSKVRQNYMKKVHGLKTKKHK